MIPSKGAGRDERDWNMKHLWQAAMEALENGIRENDLFFDVTDTSSPYGDATVKNAYNPYGPS